MEGVKAMWRSQMLYSQLSDRLLGQSWWSGTRERNALSGRHQEECGIHILGELNFANSLVGSWHLALTPRRLGGSAFSVLNSRIPSDELFFSALPRHGIESRWDDLSEICNRILRSVLCGFPGTSYYSLCVWVLRGKLVVFHVINSFLDFPFNISPFRPNELKLVFGFSFHAPSVTVCLIPMKLNRAHGFGLLTTTLT